MTHELTGAWMHEAGNQEQLLQFIDGYSTHTTYSKVSKTFIKTNGGIYTTKDNQLIVVIEFDTEDKEQTGQSLVYSFLINGNDQNRA